MSNDKMCGVPFVVRKNGHFYRHNSCGYTTSLYEAELFTEDRARYIASEHHGCVALPVTKVCPSADYAEAVFERVEAIRDAMLAERAKRQEGQ